MRIGVSKEMPKYVVKYFTETIIPGFPPHNRTPHMAVMNIDVEPDQLKNPNYVTRKLFEEGFARKGVDLVFDITWELLEENNMDAESPFDYVAPPAKRKLKDTIGDLHKAVVLMEDAEIKRDEAKEELDNAQKVYESYKVWFDKLTAEAKELL